MRTLGDALNPRFDGFYTNIVESVRFDKCELGYILEAEGPQAAAIFQGDTGASEL